MLPEINEPNLQENINTVIDTDSIPSFSVSAYSLLKDKISVFIVELVRESARVAKRNRADDISAAHVQRAAEYLSISTRKGVYRHLGTVGGILLGGALSNVLSMTSTEHYTPLGILVTLGIAVLGSSLVAAHIVTD